MCPEWSFAVLLNSTPWRRDNFEAEVVDQRVKLNSERHLIGVDCTVGGELHVELQLLSWSWTGKFTLLQKIKRSLGSWKSGKGINRGGREGGPGIGTAS